ncbi:MAG: ABC-2 transporter permease [Bifidobacteriaceae bacterium]|jgi:hypothetical protein|nr:ABC-2 transporter permease [Bifidobacteriaceae bacterium]
MTAAPTKPASLAAFWRLEAFTFRPAANRRSLVLWIVLVVGLGALGPAGGMMAAAMVLVVGLVGAPFNYAERANLDGLYVTLGLPRRCVVAGRFAFLAGLALVAVAVSALPWAGYNLVTGLGAPSAEVAAGGLACLLATCLLVFIQLPVYFRLGYAKATLAARLPILAAVLAALALAGAANLSPTFRLAATRLAQWIAPRPGLALAAATAFVAIVGLFAYRRALASYRQREF